MANYEDDVEPIALQRTGRKAGEVTGGKVKVSTTYRNKVELEATNLNVLLELTGAGDDQDRPGIDLVAVLDVSGSMKSEGRLDDLKIAMRFLIRKLSCIDRLSIITFSTEPERLNPLLPMTQEAQDLLDKKIDQLKPRGYTNMAKGLIMASKVLDDRRVKDDRYPAIMFMSDGDPSDGDKAALVPLGHLPVHTFLVGSDSISDILKKIATNSKGGTFSITRIKNMEAAASNLSDAFAKCLGGLLDVAVQNLRVTMKPLEEEIETEDGEKMTIIPTLDSVAAGLYPQTPNQDGSQTVTFYDLYKQEKRSVLVKLGLPPVPENVVTSVLHVAYTYSDGSQDARGPPIRIRITRTKDNPEKERVEVIVEKKRLQTITHMETAKDLADNKNDLPAARNVLVTAHKSMAEENVDDPTKLIEMLMEELQLLIESMKDKETYNKIGRHLLDAALIAHKLQRSATIGNAQLQMYATDSMKKSLLQVKDFEKQIEELKENPGMELVVDETITIPNPPSPAPPKLELKDVAPQLTTHIGVALQSLETLQSSLKAIYEILDKITT